MVNPHKIDAGREITGFKDSECRGIHCLNAQVLEEEEIIIAYFRHLRGNEGDGLFTDGYRGVNQRGNGFPSREAA